LLFLGVGVTVVAFAALSLQLVPEVRPAVRIAPRAEEPLGIAIEPAAE
jgi:hypothetical protein